MMLHEPAMAAITALGVVAGTVMLAASDAGAAAVQSGTVDAAAGLGLVGIGLGLVSVGRDLVRVGESYVRVQERHAVVNEQIASTLSAGARDGVKHEIRDTDGIRHSIADWAQALREQRRGGRDPTAEVRRDEV